MTTTRVGRAAYHHGDLPNALADAATDLARESVLHVLAEQFDWLRRWTG